MEVNKNSLPLAIYILLAVLPVEMPVLAISIRISRRGLITPIGARRIGASWNIMLRLCRAVRVVSIFFSSGTCRLLMEEETVAQTLADIHRLWMVDADVEITLEANPQFGRGPEICSVPARGRESFITWCASAARDEDLKFLGRGHDVSEAKRAIELAQENFPRFSFDLIYARRDQSLVAWENELREALALADGHLSLYQLTIEPNTQFHTHAMHAVNAA